MTRELDYFERLQKSANTIKPEIDARIKEFFAEPAKGAAQSNEPGRKLLDSLILHFSTEGSEDAALKAWLEELKKKYSNAPQATAENPNPKSPLEIYFLAFKPKLADVLSLHIKAIIDVPNIIPTGEDFNCLPGLINRMADAADSYYGNVEKKFMNDFFAKQAKQLVEMGQVKEGNEVHVTVALEYLLGFVTHEQALSRDPAYRSPLNISPAEVFKIREQFYQELPKAIHKDIIEMLGIILPLIPSAEVIDRAAYNGAVQDFKNKYGEGLVNQFLIYINTEASVNNEAETTGVYQINNAAIETFINRHYPQPKFTPYNDLIETPTENLPGFIMPLEKSGILRILRNTGNTDLHGDNLVLQNKLIEMQAGKGLEEEKSAQILFGGKVEAKAIINIQGDQGKILNSIICGAPYAEIYTAVNESPEELLNNYNHYNYISRALAIRENGADILGLVRSRIPQGYNRILLDETLLTQALINRNENLLDAVLNDPGFELISLAQPGTQLHPVKQPILSTAIVINSPYFNKILEKIDSCIESIPEEEINEDGNPARERFIDKILNHKDADGNTALHAAAFNGHVNAIELLLARGAYVHATKLNGSTPLHMAAKNGHVDAIMVLLTNGADVNVVNKYGDTPLHLAAKNGHVDAIMVLLANGADVHATNLNGSTPLYMAAFNGYADVIQALIDEGKADVHAALDKSGDTPLHLAADKGHVDAIMVLLANGANVNAANLKDTTPLYMAAFNGHTGAIKALIAGGANVNALDKNGNTPLHFAAFNGHTGAIKALIAGGANVNVAHWQSKTQLHCGNTPLHLAAKNGHVDAIMVLLANGANVNALDKNGDTPLHLAAQLGHTEAIRVLLDKGANVRKTNNDGQTALDIAPQHSNAYNVLNKFLINQRNLIQAAKDGNIAEIIRLIDTEGVKVNDFLEEGKTVLHYAAENGHAETVKDLCTRGADVEAKDNMGNTALHYAAENGHAETTNALLGKWAIVDVVNLSGETALHLAAMNGDIDVINILLEDSANINAKTFKGNTPLHYAADKGHVKAIEVLVGGGTYAQLTNINEVNLEKNTPLHFAAQSGNVEIIKVLLDNEADVNAVNSIGNTPLHYAAAHSHIDASTVLTDRGANVNLKNFYGYTAGNIATFSMFASCDLKGKQGNWVDRVSQDNEVAGVRMVSAA